MLLAHVAEAMGIIAAETIAGVESMELDYVMMPRATDCQPQVASADSAVPANGVLPGDPAPSATDSASCTHR